MSTARRLSPLPRVVSGVPAGEETLRLRRGAAFALARCGASGRARAVAAGAAADEPTREIVISALGAAGAVAADQLPFLQRMLGDPSVAIQAAAVDALGQIGPAAAEAVGALAAVVESARPVRERARAARALGLIGPAAAAALPVLRKAAESGETVLELEAARAVERIEKADPPVPGGK
jgi:HEAT repeat protein